MKLLVYFNKINNKFNKKLCIKLLIFKAIIYSKNT